MTRHLLDLADLGPDTLIQVLDTADRLKAERGRHEQPLRGKQIALLFEKASTRTRLSLEIAVSELGGHPIVLTSQGSQLGRGEPMKDTARVLTRMVHGITLRTHAEERIRELVAHVDVPVLNALTDESHPMQLLADLQTVREHFGKLSGLGYAWIGDGNNMAHSWIEAAGLLGLRLRLACPAGYLPKPHWIEQAKARGADVELVDSAAEAVRGAHVLSTDVFTSMGQEAETAERLRVFAGYGLDERLLAQAEANAVVLHCLPAHRGEEISEGVLEGKHSLVWPQAENRLHTAKAALLWAFDQLPR
ncbi:MAG TPA: ornithine carbamoyltransferase [Polyangiaceae bacterium]|nr:ornithine carbamoyltransferase [Polyangiaceae bacterium]